jgi:AAA+ ATPase superfamily predicted ATPase
MENKDTRSIVLNAFQPAHAMEHPARFAGRKSIISELTDALRTEGLCPLIYGERGVGKTSIANQIERIALGDVELLSNLGLQDRALPEGSRFAAFYLQCTDGIQDCEGLLQRVINLADGFTSLSDLPRMRQTGLVSEHTVKLSFYEAKFKEEYEAVSFPREGGHGAENLRKKRRHVPECKTETNAP